MKTERFITSGHWCNLAKARANKAKASTARAKAKESKDSKDSTDRTRTRARTSKDSVECWNCGKRGHHSKERLLEQEEHQSGSKGKHKPNNADAHNLDSKPSIVEPEVEIDEFNTSYLDVDALQQQESERMRGSEWIRALIILSVCGAVLVRGAQERRC